MFRDANVLFYSHLKNNYGKIKWLLAKALYNFCHSFTMQGAGLTIMSKLRFCILPKELGIELPTPEQPHTQK